MRIILDQPDRMFFSNPCEVLSAKTADEAWTAFAKIEAALKQGLYVAGWLGYELGYILEPRLAALSAPGKPLMQVGIYRGPCETMPMRAGRSYVGPLTPEWNAAQYGERFAIVKDYIAAGDIYQANLSFRSHFAFVGDPLDLYERLRGETQSRYCAFVEFDDCHGSPHQIVSLAPELFFDLTRGGAITARPMKGTAPRVGDDNDARIALATSIKERAENLMIVDLIRNDLGRIAEVGTVKVPELFSVETYPSFHTMVSTVTARKTATAGLYELIKALFPCGSVTGAPKIRAMQILASLEQSRRGAYCGAIGHFAPDGSARFNVSIRTLTLSGDRGEIGLGGGVVQDSRESAEYAECLLKGRFLDGNRRPLELIETIRFEHGFVRLDGHLARMAASATVFGLPFNEKKARSALQDAIAGSDGPLRVRLTLDEGGRNGVTVTNLGQNPLRWTYEIATTHVRSTDVLQRHKTNWREAYDSVVTDADEILFTNERGELVEGRRTNIFLEREGILLTPPLSAGALDGRLRAELIEKGRAREATLMPTDLQTGRAYCGNSLRGLIPLMPRSEIPVEIWP